MNQKSHSVLLLVVLATLLIYPAIESVAATPKIYRETVKPQWVSDNTSFWYRNDLAEGTVEFVMVDAKAGTRNPAFDHERVAAVLSDLLAEPVDSRRLPIESLEYSLEKDVVTLLGVDQSWLLDLEAYTITPVAGSAGVQSLPFNRQVRPSRSLSGHTFITFINRRNETVKLFWVDASGGRHIYAELTPGERRRQHSYTGHVWLVTRENDQVIAVFDAPGEEAAAIIDYREPDLAVAGPATLSVAIPQSSVPSPDGSLAVFVQSDNLWLRDLQTGKQQQLSFDGCAGDTYRLDIQRDRLIEMDYEAPAAPDSTPDVIWSPDSRFLVARRTPLVKERTVYMVRSAPDDQLQPRLESYPYLKAGDKIPVGSPHLFDVTTQTQLAVDESLWAGAWDISDYHWTPDSSRLFFLYNKRGHQSMKVFSIDVRSGKTSVVVDEQCTTFFDYQGKTYLRHLDKTNELLWMSERDGWNHLYVYDRKKGREKKQLTKGSWVVRSVDRVDEELRQIWFRACGIVPGQDPYYIHYCRVDMDGKNLTVLTDGNGTHHVQWSPDNLYLIDSWSRVDIPPQIVLRDGKTGKQICEMEKADISELLAAGHIFPEPYVAKGRDGITDIYGVIHRPVTFDKSVTYPVIESIYAGPHGHHVPKEFKSQFRQQELADKGFIVVQIDGMGTNWRSKKFHDVCWQNIVDGGFPDRIKWIKAAAREYPYLDLSHVGIYGGSAGGQNALAALLTHGDFYHAAMADCGCHDNRMDKIWWNEQWMGYPVGPHYESNSNVSLAGNLVGKLLLIVGELDRNVDPASTMQVVDALIDADKDFELLVMPGMGHGAASSEYGRRRTYKFFERHLLGKSN